MFSTDDTIVAIATPPGRGGIGVVRLSGPDAERVARGLMTGPAALKPRYATLVTIAASLPHDAGDPRPLDQALVTFFPGPHSYTGEDVVEISTHGSPVVLQAIVATAVQAGARAARAGEFTLRAFLHDRIDLAQAEAVADLIDAATPLQAHAAFEQLQGTLTRAINEIDDELFDLIVRLEASIDFPDEGYHFVEPGTVGERLAAVREKLTRLVARGAQGRLIREGRVIAIVGPPNAGKSSLFNALLGAPRSIVTSTAGTTRDLVSEAVDFEGLRVTLVDTAGLRETVDPIESEGVRRSNEAIAHADLVVRVQDGTGDPRGAEGGDGAAVLVRSKSDLPGFHAASGWISVSAVSGEGLETLRRVIGDRLGHTNYGECPEISDIRHLHLVEQALSVVTSAERGLGVSGGTLPEEFLLVDLQTAHRCLGEVTGRSASDDLLDQIFSRFCIGK